MATEVLAASGDRKAVKTIVSLFARQGEESPLTNEIINTIVHFGRGPVLRSELFRLFVENDDEELRKRISAVSGGRYLG